MNRIKFILKEERKFKMEYLVVRSGNNFREPSFTVRLGKLGKIIC